LIGQYVVAFRETLEAAIIIAIILSYLARSGRRNFSRFVWLGVASAVTVSLGTGMLVWYAYGALPETIKMLFESLTAFIAVLVLSTVIYWMTLKGGTIHIEMERRTEVAATRGASLGLLSLSFVVVFREGFETILFLTPFFLADALGSLVGTSLGIFTAIMLAYGIFIVGMKINLQRFFYFTGVLLILLAGGLAGYGTHELLEYFEAIGLDTGWLGESAYTLNIPVDSPFHHRGAVGSILAVMFGYTISAEWARVIVHSAYLLTALPLLSHIYRKKNTHRIFE